MSVPGVNVICATSFLAAIGDIHRFRNPRNLVGYLGLDPKIRQSGPGPATSGHISKQGSASARWALVEASWSTVRQPGPMRAFYQRVRARRGHQIAVVAAARKLACLFWCLLTRGEDYAYQQPSLTKKKLRRLEIAAGAPKYQGRSNIWSTNVTMREAERALAEQAEHAYKNTVRDWQASQAKKPAVEVGASATPGRALDRPSKGKAARQTTSP
jgi:transposase